MYGLLGWPVKHSFSPAMHNAAFKALGINAEYKLFPVAPDDIDTFLGSLDPQSVSGLNVTVPYKEKALAFVTLDQESLFLKQIKAINTIVNRDGRWLGFNTDIPGFSRHLLQQRNPAGKNVAILGAGGACRAVAYVLAQCRARQISIFDIDRQKADAIVEMIKDIFSGFPIHSAAHLEELDIPHQDILINATPVGLKETDPLLVEPLWLHRDMFVYDLIYNPAQTRLLRAASENGCQVSNGLGMLLYQGMLSFQIWTGAAAPEEVFRTALESALRH